MYDYSRPIPTSMMPTTVNVNGGKGSDLDLGGGGGEDLEAGNYGDPDDENTRLVRTRSPEEFPSSSAGDVSSEASSLDCVICYSEIDPRVRSKYMLAPCNHIFCRHCLEQWMEIKMQCPVCRCDLPAI